MERSSHVASGAGSGSGRTTRAVRATQRSHPHIQTLLTVDVDPRSGIDAAHLPDVVRHHQAWAAGIVGIALGLASGITVGVGDGPSSIEPAAPSEASGGLVSAVRCRLPLCDACDTYDRVGIPHFGS